MKKQIVKRKVKTARRAREENYAEVKSEVRTALVHDIDVLLARIDNELDDSPTA
jgi:hypothetical protein